VAIAGLTEIILSLPIAYTVCVACGNRIQSQGALNGETCTQISWNFAVQVLQWIEFDGFVCTSRLVMPPTVTNALTALLFAQIVFAIGWCSCWSLPACFRGQHTHGVVLFSGADDIFVFMDAWRQSLYEGPLVRTQPRVSGIARVFTSCSQVLKDLETRATWVYHRAASAMFVTSGTTMAAFLATAVRYRWCVRLSSMPYGCVEDFTTRGSRLLRHLRCDCHCCGLHSCGAWLWRRLWLC